MRPFIDPDTGDLFSVDGPSPESAAPRRPFVDPDTNEVFQPEISPAPAAISPDELTDTTSLADYGKSIMSGGAGVAGGLGWLLKQFGDEDWGDDGDYTTRIGRAIQDLGSNAVDYWNDSLSEGAKNELAKEFVTKDENGEWQWGDASLKTVGLYGAQSLLGTAAGMGAGAGITKTLQFFGNPVARGALVNTVNAGRGAAVGSVAEKAATAAAKKLKLVDRVLGAAGFGLGEGMVGGMMTGVNVEEQIMSLDDEKLMSTPRFREIYESQIKSGISPETALASARETIAKEGASVAGLQAGLTTALLGAPMGAFFGPLFSRAGLRNTTRLAATGIGAAGEAAQEFAQSGFEAYTSNKALIAAGDPRDIWDDVLNQAVGGAAAGAAMGGAFGAAGGADPADVAKKQEKVAKKRVEDIKANYGALEKVGIRAMEAGVPKDEIDKVLAETPAGGMAQAAKQLRELAEQYEAGEAEETPSVEEALADVEATRPKRKKGKRKRKTAAEPEAQVPPLDDETVKEQAEAPADVIPNLTEGQKAWQTEYSGWDRKDAVERAGIENAEGVWQKDWSELTGEQQVDISKAVQTRAAKETAADEAAAQGEIDRHNKYIAGLRETGDPVDAAVADIEEQHEAWRYRNIDDEANPTAAELSQDIERVDALVAKGEKRAFDLAVKHDWWANWAEDENGRWNPRQITVKTSDPYFKGGGKNNKWGAIQGFDHTYTGNGTIGVSVTGTSWHVSENSLTFKTPEDEARYQRLADIYNKVNNRPPPVAETPEDVAAQAHEAATSPENDRAEPTEAQKEYGNYKKGKVKLNHLPAIMVENPDGSVRKGKGWERTMKGVHYGYFQSTEGADNEQDGTPREGVDVMVNAAEGATDETLPVFVINQQVDGQFDEHKVMVGFADAQEAAKAYKRQYERGWKGLQSMQEMTAEQFSEWVKDPENTTKPAEPLPSLETPAWTDLSVTPAEQAAQAPAPKGSIGLNANGFPVYEDENGVRSYVESGIRISEPVQIIPGEGSYVDKENRGEDFSTQQEVSDGLETAPTEQEAPATAGQEESEAQEEGLTLDENGNVAFEIDEAAFNKAYDEWERVFETPPKGEPTVEKRAKEAGFIPLEEAQARVDQWREDAIAQGTANPDNFQRTILSLFDLTGNWARPYAEAGYNVWTFDIQNGEDVNDFSVEWFNENTDFGEVYGILAACPCTDFANSGARWFKDKDADGRTEMSVELVEQTLRTVEYFRPKFWVLENPVGRIEKLTSLPPWRTAFQPHNFGDPYTKKTLLWGKFNAADIPIANVEPTEGSKMHNIPPGPERANIRSETPMGFAYGFFKANNFADTAPEERTVADYPEAEGAIREGFRAGMSEEAIRDIMYEYYENLEPEAAIEAVREAIQGTAPEPSPPSVPNQPVEPETPPAEAAAPIDPSSDIVVDQDFGDLELTYEVEVEETGEMFTVTEDATLTFKRAAKRRDNLEKLWECVRG